MYTYNCKLKASSAYNTMQDLALRCVSHASILLAEQCKDLNAESTRCMSATQGNTRIGSDCILALQGAYNNHHMLLLKVT